MVHEKLRHSLDTLRCFMHVHCTCWWCHRASRKHKSQSRSCVDGKKRGSEFINFRGFQVFGCDYLHLLVCSTSAQHIFLGRSWCFFFRFSFSWVVVTHICRPEESKNDFVPCFAGNSLPISPQQKQQQIGRQSMMKLWLLPIEPADRSDTQEKASRYPPFIRRKKRNRSQFEFLVLVKEKQE